MNMQSVFKTSIFVLLPFVALADFPWWPYGTSNSLVSRRTESFPNSRFEPSTPEPVSHNLTETRKFPPLPWIFTGGLGAPNESKNRIVDFFKRGLQNMHLPEEISGTWLPPAPNLPQPQKITYPSELSKLTNPTDKSCEPDKPCTLKLRSFETHDPLFRYVYEHTSSMDPLLQKVFDYSRNNPIAPPLSADLLTPGEVISLSMSLMEATAAKMTLIVGVFTGLSVIGAALATNKDGRILAVENPEYLKYWQTVGYKFVKETALMDKIIVQGAKPVPQYLESLAKTQPSSFDFIILDDYDVENYKIDYLQCFDLLRPKGIMMINNVLYNGKVLSGQQYQDIGAKTIADLNAKLKNDWRVVANLLPIGNGVMLVTKK